MKIEQLGHYLMRGLAMVLILYGLIQAGPLVNWGITLVGDIVEGKTKEWVTEDLFFTLKLLWPVVACFLFGFAMWFKSRQVTGITKEELKTEVKTPRFKIFATMCISMIGLYFIGFALVNFADRFALTIEVFKFIQNDMQETPQRYADDVEKPNTWLLLAPIYLPLISMTVGLLLTEGRRIIINMFFSGPVTIEAEEAKQYDLIHRLMMIIFGLLAFGFGLQWIGNAVSGVFKFVQLALSQSGEDTLSYERWATFTSDIYGPLTQMVLAMLLLALAKPLCRWLKPYKIKS